MALIIEDGSVVVGADSFATAAELAAYAESFGGTIPSDAAAQESLLRRAALQMDALSWKGKPVSAEQCLSWPRSGAERNGFPISHDAIPAQIKQGQMALAVEIHADDRDPPEKRKGAVTGESVSGAVSRQYATVTGAAARHSAGRQSSTQFRGLVVASSQVRVVRA